MIRNRPTVSVIIPTYNRARLLPRAINSVLNQTYRDFELIVVDDASADNTIEVVKQFQEKDDRIKYLKHSEHKGGSGARNTGIKASAGEYIGLLDDDDEWLPGKLEKQMNKLENSSLKVGVVYSGFFYVSEKNGKIVSEVIPLLRGEVYANLLKSCILGSPTPLIKKKCFQKVGFFDETLPSCQDWDMWIRLSKYYDFDFVPDILAKHHVHGGQISVDLNAKIVAREKLIEKYLVDLSKNSQAFSAVLKRLGILYFLAGNQGKGRKYFLKSIKQKPFQKGSYIHFFLSFLPHTIYRNVLKIYSVTNIDEVTFYY